MGWMLGYDRERARKIPSVVTLEQLDEMGFDMRDKGSANAVDDLQRQTVISQFFQLDRLVVEGQKTVSLLLHVPVKTSLFSTDLL